MSHSGAQSLGPTGPSATNGATANGGSGNRPRGGVWASIWFVVRAAEIRLRFIAVLVAIGLVIGYWETIKNYVEKWVHEHTATVQEALPSDSEFYCPMHPNVIRTSLEPDGSIPKCPICGMPLSKRRKGEVMALPEGIVSRVQFSPYQIQAAGIRTVPAELRPLVYRMRTVGYVAYDETRLSRIVTRVNGYLEKLYVNQTFQQVAADQPLAEIYSPELFSAVEELRLSVGVRNEQMAEAARRKLRLLGVGDKEIEAAISGTAYRLVLRAPWSGTVIAKYVVEGSAVQAGQTLVELADLSTVWIEADVYERDLPWVYAGQQVTATVEAYPDRTFPGEVSLIYPQLNERTRTARVRFAIVNPERLLRPGMFATVHLEVPLVETEPFRSLAGGQPLGPEADEAAQIARQRICPVTGLRLGSMGKPVRAEVDHQVVYLCCAACRGQAESAPEKVLARIRTVSENGVLAIPEDAVIDTGEHKVVYVERQPGVFEGVSVRLGPRAEGYYAVLEGLLPGDRVAAAGAFLIDAETRLNPAAASTYFGASGHQH